MSSTDCSTSDIPSNQLREAPYLPTTDSERRTILPRLNHIQTQDSGQLQVTYPVPSRRNTEIVQGLLEHHPAVAEVTSAHVGSVTTELRACVSTIADAFGVYDAFLCCTGACRVCGSVDCLKGVVHTKSGLMHRDSHPEADRHPDETLQEQSLTDLV